MPNTPCIVGKGIVTSFCSEDFDPELQGFLFDSLETLSTHQQIDDEVKFDEVTPILGSGPGYIFEFARIIQSELRMLGIDTLKSKELTLKLIGGCMDLAKSSDESFDLLREKVTSKGGVTERMLEVISEHNLEKVLNLAIVEGRKRGKSL